LAFLRQNNLKEKDKNSQEDIINKIVENNIKKMQEE
jgi:hypothetical protein